MLSFTKNYLRVDFTDDDALLTSLETVSKKFILQATGHTIDDVNSEYDKLVLAMTVKHFYDNRDSVSDTVLEAVPFTLRSFYLQLQASVVTE